MADTSVRNIQDGPGKRPATALPLSMALRPAESTEEAQARMINELMKQNATLTIRVEAAEGRAEAQAARHEKERVALKQKLVERDRKIKDLQKDLDTDKLTGIGNRNAFNKSIENEAQSFIRHGIDFSVIMIDVNYLKRVNDDFGHLAGDELIRTVGNALRDEKRPIDVVTRLGGDEFAVVLPETDIEGARIFIKRVFNKLMDTSIDFAEGGRVDNVVIAAGVSSAINGLSEDFRDRIATMKPGDKVNAKSYLKKLISGLITCADDNMYRHKASLKDPNQTDLMPYTDC